MFVAESFIQNLVNKYGNHPVSTDTGTWYPFACKFLKLRHHLHSSFEKSIIERTIQYIKDRTEYFDDYFPCRKKRCKLNHVTSWFNVFIDHIILVWLLKLTEPGIFSHILLSYMSIFVTIRNCLLMQIHNIASSCAKHQDNRHNLLLPYLSCIHLLMLYVIVDS
jgi:hypothetical protein